MMSYYVDTGTEVKRVTEWAYEALVRLHGYAHRIHTDRHAVIFKPVRGRK